MTELKNFTWINNIEFRTTASIKLLNYYEQISPSWTSELDAAMRIVFFASNGGLASKKATKHIVNSIEHMFQYGNIYTSDILDIAVEVMENPYFQCNAGQKGLYFTKAHCDLVISANDKWSKKKIRETQLANHTISS
jgi:hypothetical protein